MIRRIVLVLTLMAAGAPVLAQPPAPPSPPTAAPSAQASGGQAGQAPDQPGRQRGFGRRNREGDGQGFGGLGGAPNGGRGFARGGGGAGGPAEPGSSLVAAPSMAAAPQGRAVAPPRSGPPPLSADALVVRALQGSVSAVFDPGVKTARIKLIETDDHGVEGVRTLKPGEVYRDGWRLSAVTATQATLRKGKTLLLVDLTRGWPNQPAQVQPAVLVQPVPAATAFTPSRGGFGPAAGQAGRRDPLSAPAVRGPRPASNPALGLSDARAGGSPPPPPAAAQSVPGPAGHRP